MALVDVVVWAYRLYGSALGGETVQAAGRQGLHGSHWHCHTEPARLLADIVNVGDGAVNE